MTVIVGIGASAGGLKALEAFFKAVPEYSELAYVVLQHSMKEQGSMLTELLQRKTSLPVKEIKDNMQLFEPTGKEGVLHPIDSFFRALA